MARKSERVRGSNRDHEKEQFWRETVRAWRRSGLTVRDFCAEHDLSEPSFYSWRRILAQRDLHVANRQCSRRTARPLAAADAQPSEPPAFVPLHVTASTTPSLELVLASAHVIRLAPDFDATALRRLLAVLAEAPSC